MKKTSFYFSALLALAIMLLPVIGCMGERSSNETQVQMKITRGTPGSISSAIIEPSQHPIVSVVVTVSAPDIDPPLVFTFPASEVAANFGVVQMQVPTGLARTFDVTVLEVIPPVPNQFPGKVYVPTSTAANRTYNLTGTPLLMNLNVSQAPTGSIGGVLWDTRTGTRMELTSCDAEVDMVFKVGALVDPAGPVKISVGGVAAGDYAITNVPLDMPINITVADGTTGALATADVVVPSSAGSLTQDIDLIGASPLALSPSSASVLPGQALVLTRTGGALPINVSLSLNNSGGTLVQTGPNTYLYTAGPAGATQDQISITDSCLVGAASTINVNYVPANNIWRVDSAAPYPGDGLTWGTAFTYIQDAITAAMPGDEIWVKGGSHGIPPASTTGAVIAMKDSVRILGGFQGTEMTLADRGNPPAVTSTLNGNYSACHVVIGNSNAVLDHFDLIYGYSDTGTPYCTNIGGSGIYNLNVTGTVFNSVNVQSNTTPGEMGGGVKNNNSNVSFVNSSISFNAANTNGGGIYNLNSPIELINTAVLSNSAAAGGGIFNKFSNMSMSDYSAISSNTAGANDGGGMYNYGSAVTLSNNTYMTGNNGWSGGAIFNTSGSTLNVSGAYITSNSATQSYGGAIDSRNSSLTIDDTFFWGNKAYYGGGAIFDMGSVVPVSITNSMLTSNYCDAIMAPIFGGAIMTDNSQLIISNSVFGSNMLTNYPTGNRYGGALYLRGSGSTANIMDSKFNSNMNTSGKGGAVAVGAYATLNLSNTMLSNNFADRGGGLFTDIGTTTTVSNSTFFDNRAYSGSLGGGAIFSQSSVANHSTAAINNNVFYNNSSNGRGGAIFNVNDSSPTIINNTFYRNYAYKGGGAMYNYGNSYPVVMNSILWNDYAGNYDYPPNNEIENNAGSSPTVTYSDASEDYYRGAPYYDWQRRVYPGAGNIYNDPIFFDINYSDLHLNPASPAINMGNPDPAYNDPDGSRNDMGAFGGPNTKHFDRDYDGMEDWWEIGYGLNPNDPADALLDPDGDLMINLEEFRNGTNPWVFDFPIG